MAISWTAIAVAPEPHNYEPREYLALLIYEDPDLNIDDYYLIDRIIVAESGWKPEAKNPLSTASGLLQYLDSTFKAYCIDKYGFTGTMGDKNDPFIQLQCGVEMIGDGGLSHWNASRHLWQ